MEKLSYWVDRQDVIYKVSESWDANMDPECWTDRASGKVIIGKSLFDFVCDDETRMYIKSILDVVRLLPQSAFRYYRCDTPTLKRYMRMVISWEHGDSVCFSHEQIKSEPLIRKVIFTPVNKQVKRENNSKADLARPYQYVRCSLCNQISKDGYSGWGDADKLAETGITFSVIEVSYGICQNCLKGMAWPAKFSNFLK